MARDAAPANLFQLVAAVQQFGAGFLAPDHRAEIRVQHHGAAGVFEGMAVAGFRIALRRRVLGENNRMRIEFDVITGHARQCALRDIQPVQQQLGGDLPMECQSVAQIGCRSASPVTTHADARAWASAAQAAIMVQQSTRMSRGAKVRPSLPMNHTTRAGQEVLNGILRLLAANVETSMPPGRDGRNFLILTPDLPYRARCPYFMRLLTRFSVFVAGQFYGGLNVAIGTQENTRYSNILLSPSVMNDE